MEVGMNCCIFETSGDQNNDPMTRYYIDVHVHVHVFMSGVDIQGNNLEMAWQMSDQIRSWSDMLWHG